MRADTNLLDLQRRFMAALGEPILDDSRARSELPPRTGTASPAFVETAETLFVSSPTLHAAERLELYHRQYWYRLLDSIAEDFPGLRTLLGDEAFWRLMEAYLEFVPSRSFTLRHLGESLPDFIATHAATLSHPVHAEELARLEAALCASFEAAEHPPISATALGHAQIGLQPHLQLLALRTPAERIWQRTTSGRSRGRLRAPAQESTRYVAVFREDLALRVERMPRTAFLILSTIAETGSLDTAMERLERERVLSGARDGERVTAWFQQWVSRGWLTSQPTKRRLLRAERRTS